MTDSCMLCHLRVRELSLLMGDLEISLEFLAMHWTSERARHTVRILRKCRELCRKLDDHSHLCADCFTLIRPVVWRVENWKSITRGPARSGVFFSRPAESIGR